MSTAPAKVPLICVLVPTFRRPALLAKTLGSLEAQRTAMPFTVAVADNDAEGGEGEAAAIAWAARSGFADRLRTCRVAERGLSSNRNGGLALAFADPRVTAAAMIDDDSEADAGWVAAVARALEAGSAAILGGPTIYGFEGEVAPWISGADMFDVPFQASGPVDRLRSSNNCIVTRRLYERLGPTLFHPAFNATGGEDAHLFARCGGAGLASEWVADAVVRELVPARRCTDAWVIQRHRVSAANNARIETILNGPAAAWRRQGGLIAKELAAGLIKGLSPRKMVRFEARLRLAGVAGRLDGLAHRLALHDSHAEDVSRASS